MRFGLTSAMVGTLAMSRLGADGGSGAWEQLGCQKVGFLVDKDVISVGRDEGRFRSIRLLVSGNKVHMMDLKVIYANGQPDDIPVREEIRAGGQTRALDLKGERRAIKEIEMVYRSQPNFKGQAPCAWRARPDARPALAGWRGGSQPPRQLAQHEACAERQRTARRSPSP